MRWAAAGSGCRASEGRGAGQKWKVRRKSVFRKVRLSEAEYLCGNL